MCNYLHRQFSYLRISACYSEIPVDMKPYYMNLPFPVCSLSGYIFTPEDANSSETLLMESESKVVRFHITMRAMCDFNLAQ